MTLRHWITILSILPLGLAATTSAAQGTGGSSSATPGMLASLVPESVTMDQKLAAADQVFIGSGRRIYFLDRSGREIALDAASRGEVAGASRQAILEVAVEEELNAPNSQRKGGVAKFLLEAPVGIGAKPLTYDELAARHIDKKGIYFARRQLPPAGESGGATGQGSAQPMLLKLVNTPARRGPVDNPLPITERQTVMNAMLTNGHVTEDPNCF